MSGNDTLIDLTHLQACSGGDSAFEKEILELFVADSHGHLTAVKAAIAIQDFETIRREAHHIKGASSNVGANGMQALAQAVEHHASADQLDRLSSLLVELEALWAAVAKQVETWTDAPLESSASGPESFPE